MNDLICKKTMRECATPNPCAKGCQMNATGDPQNDCGGCALANNGQEPDWAGYAAAEAEEDVLHSAACDLFRQLEADKNFQMACMDGTINVVGIIKAAWAARPAAVGAGDLFTNARAAKILIQMREHMMAWGAAREGHVELDIEDDDAEGYAVFAGECLRFIIAHLPARPTASAAVDLKGGVA